MGNTQQNAHAVSRLHRFEHNDRTRVNNELHESNDSTVTITDTSKLPTTNSERSHSTQYEHKLQLPQRYNTTPQSIPVKHDDNQQLGSHHECSSRRHLNSHLSWPNSMNNSSKTVFENNPHISSESVTLKHHQLKHKVSLRRHSSTSHDITSSSSTATSSSSKHTQVRRRFSSIDTENTEVTNSSGDDEFNGDETTASLSSHPPISPPAFSTTTHFNAPSSSSSTTTTSSSTTSSCATLLRSFPMGGKTTAHKQRIVRLWCSWCFTHALHARVVKNRVRRSVYQCLECVRRTVMCTWCSIAMARGHSDYDDFLCFKCDNTIACWGVIPQSIRTLGFCSWCFDLSSHEVRVTNIVRRNAYMCESCGGRTALCITCKRAFTRCNTFTNDIQCFLCQGQIQDWSQVSLNRKMMKACGSLVLEENDPYVSVFPTRRAQYVRALIDAKEMYDALATALERAEKTIFMSFWHFNLHIYLRRNKGESLNIKDRIDTILHRKAVEGVRIYVILWRENVSVLVNNFSHEMKRKLNNLHPNICAIRHGHPTPLTTYFCHHQKFVVVDQEIAFVGGLDVCLGRYDDCLHELTDETSQTWIGIDYYNPHLCRPSTLKTNEIDIIDRHTVPRMPWHDVDVELHGNAARDIAHNFIERWNHHVASSYANAGYDTLQADSSEQFSTQAGSFNGTCVIQVIRSMSQWSGATRLDRSIYGAYLQAVNSAEKYIYIENQYLSSNVAGGGVENIVARRILDRLRHKIRSQATFRVIIVLPQPEESGDSAMELLRWQYQTINRGGSSMLEQLNDEFPEVNLEDYISFFFLRQYGFLQGKPVTEKIFTHSKLMLVDDRISIVSSANFNDRSFLGDRDSELGVTIEDEYSLTIAMDGQSWQAGRFPHELRMRLWQEHLGLSDSELPSIVDATCDRVYHGLWLSRARKNTEIYEHVFPSIPRDIYTTLKTYKEAGGLKVPAPAVTNGSELKDIRGALTIHPIGFLLEEELCTILSSLLGEGLAQ